MLTFSRAPDRIFSMNKINSFEDFCAVYGWSGDSSKAKEAYQKYREVAEELEGRARMDAQDENKAAREAAK